VIIAYNWEERTLVAHVTVSCVHVNLFYILIKNNNDLSGIPSQLR
jgi:hypothetical protein